MNRSNNETIEYREQAAAGDAVVAGTCNAETGDATIEVFGGNVTHRFASCGRVFVPESNTKGLLFKTGNDLGAYFEQNRRSDGVCYLADGCFGTNLGQIEIRVRRVALGCVARMSSVVRDFGCFVTNPALAGA